VQNCNKYIADTGMLEEVTSSVFDDVMYCLVKPTTVRFESRKTVL